MEHCCDFFFWIIDRRSKSAGSEWLFHVLCLERSNSIGRNKWLSLLIIELHFNLPNIQGMYDQFVFEEHELQLAYHRCTRKCFLLLFVAFGICSPNCCHDTSRKPILWSWFIPCGVYGRDRLRFQLYTRCSNYIRRCRLECRETVGHLIHSWCLNHGILTKPLASMPEGNC